LRKLTAVYYLNPSWRSSLGGLFRIHHPPPHHDTFTDIEPIADRLLVFWFVASCAGGCVGLGMRFVMSLVFDVLDCRADDLVHSVTPSYALGGQGEYRWSMTVWVSVCTAPKRFFMLRCLGMLFIVMPC